VRDRGRSEAVADRVRYYKEAGPKKKPAEAGHKDLPCGGCS